MPVTYQSAFATMDTTELPRVVCDASQDLTATGDISTLAPHSQPPLQELSTHPSAFVIEGLTGWKMHRVQHVKKGRGVGLESKTPALLICGRQWLQTSQETARVNMATLCQGYHASHAAQVPSRRLGDSLNVLCVMLVHSRQPLQPRPLLLVLCVMWGISVHLLGSFSVKHAPLVTTLRCLAV